MWSGGDQTPKAVRLKTRATAQRCLGVEGAVAATVYMTLVGISQCFGKLAEKMLEIVPESSPSRFTVGAAAAAEQ